VRESKKKKKLFSEDTLFFVKCGRFLTCRNLVFTTNSLTFGFLNFGKKEKRKNRKKEERAIFF
jgi:hypothetical protein